MVDESRSFEGGQLASDVKNRLEGWSRVNRLLTFIMDVTVGRIWQCGCNDGMPQAG
jgi:hypothetical protein